MPYTNKSIAFVWLIICGLVAMTGSGMIAGAWLVMLVLVALAAPALILRSPAGATTTSRERPLDAAGERGRSPSDHGRVDLSGWENEGGARRLHVSG
jgi:uncharacterized protein (DUF58 family)